ncbi:MAG: glycosyltransferase family 25 protein [Bauldia sp.]
MPSVPSIRGYYINLDRAEERRKSMELQLEKYGLSENYARFPAIDGKAFPKREGGRLLSDGEVAIFRSHRDVLSQSAHAGAYVHVLEDDAVLSALLKPFLGNALKLGLFSIFDVVFLDFIVAPDLYQIGLLRAASTKAFSKTLPERAPSDFAIIDGELVYFLGASSYIVNPDALRRLLKAFEAEWDAGVKLPVDHLFRREIRAGRLRAGCALPFVTTVGIAEAVATQSGRRDDPDLAVALALLRQSFFVERDLPHLVRQADDLIAKNAAGGPRDQHNELIYKLAAHFTR